MFRLLPTRVPTHGTRHRHARKQPPTRTAVLSSHFADPLTLDNNDRSSQRTRAQPSISTRQHNFNCLIREAEPPQQPPRITDAATWAQSPPACRLRNQQLVEARVESTQLQCCAQLVRRHLQQHPLPHVRKVLTSTRCRWCRSAAAAFRSCSTKPLRPVGRQTHKAALFERQLPQPLYRHSACDACPLATLRHRSPVQREARKIASSRFRSTLDSVQKNHSDRDEPSITDRQSKFQSGLRGRSFSSFLTASLHFRRVSRQGLHFPDLPPPFKHFPFTPSYEPVARGIFQASDSSVLKPLENCTT